ncbi:nucleoside deaminase [Desulfospira joergensenii]|uniref:nucleoside deaminase n=1 Tax=Desulfospira joergensenii TaxID=53329 RepID=UPI0003B379F6|nr:nucleoside deaminase [Desulfospira joergensenii]
MRLQAAMQIAVDQAKKSLCEGNNGFGAVILLGDRIIAQGRDTEETRQDPTAHAEINVIRQASRKLGTKDLSGCILITTHEPCPMCAAAIVWSGIKKIVFGFSIEDALKQGRRRIGIPCREIFSRAGAKVMIEKGPLGDECALLYNGAVRQEIQKLRNATKDQLLMYNEESTRKRLEWFEAKVSSCHGFSDDKIKAGYQLLLSRFNIREDQAPIVERTGKKILFHSKNFCPTLEACRILDLDTRYICRYYNERSTDLLVKQIDKNLRFTRNYKKIRPYSEYCEEMILLDG